MTIKKFTKTEIWDARKDGKTFAQLLEGLAVPPTDIKFLEDTFGPACTKWSQLIAWSWLDQNLLFKGKDLKLAEYIQAEFQAEMAKQIHKNTPSASQELEKFLLSLEERFTPLAGTLYFVQDLNFVFNKDFENHFYLQVHQDFEGWIEIDTEQEHNGKKPKLTMGLAYPDRTHLYLEWMNYNGPQEEPPAYLPTGTF